MFIRPKDLFIIYPHIKTYGGCWKKYEALRQIIGKAKKQKITLKEFSDSEGVDLIELKAKLKIA